MQKDKRNTLVISIIHEKRYARYNRKAVRDTPYYALTATGTQELTREGVPSCFLSGGGRRGATESRRRNSSCSCVYILLIQDAG
jgi:hypothetical protein